MTNASDSTVFYHQGDPDDPFITDPQRKPTTDDYQPCWTCDCTSTLDSDPGCRCSCHSQRRHH